MRRKDYIKAVKFIYISILTMIFLNLFILDLDNNLSSKRRRACDKFLKFSNYEQKQFVLLKKNWKPDPKNKDKIAERLTKEGLLRMKKLWEPNIKLYRDKEIYLKDLNKWQSISDPSEEINKYRIFCNNYRYNYDNTKFLGNLILFLILCLFLGIF